MLCVIFLWAWESIAACRKISDEVKGEKTGSMKKWRMIQFAFTMILIAAGILFGGNKLIASGLDNSEVGEASDITHFDDRVGGYSHVGIKVYWEDQLECYALDTYKKNERGIWQYIMSNINGQKAIADSYRGDDNPIWLRDKKFDSAGRFLMRGNLVKKDRTDYNVYLDLYLKGELVWSGYEIADVKFGHGTIDCGSRSFKLNTMQDGGYDAEGMSLVYRVYNPRIIEPDGSELSLDAHGGTVEKTGKAYYRKEGLYLYELPSVSMKKAGHTCTFQGWFSAAQGGTEYKVGDILQKGDKLHARWSITPNQYDVTCIDVRGDNPDGPVLGQTGWKADFGTTADAAKAGTNKAVGTYYPHCFYKDSTTAQVTENGAVVYRYFSYESCPVEYIDQIEEGSRRGENLGICSQRREYSATAQGSDIGMASEPGTYYKGYYYTRCTSQQVREQGTIVYRYFKPVKYSIAIDGNGATEGEMADIQNCEYDRPVTLEKSCFRKNSLVTLYQNEQKNPAETTNMAVKQKFMGWSTQKNGVVRYADGETVKNISAQNGTVTLYAVWSEESVALPSLAAPMGYHFLGWAKTADAQTGLMQMNVTDSEELYAVWKRDVVKYHVEYYKENLAGGYDLASSYQFDGYTDDEASVDSIDKISPGFALDESSSKLSGRIKADGSLILCAYYRRNSYEFQYDLSGGTLDTGDELSKERIKFGTNLILPSVIPHRDGYLFQGWYQDSDKTHTLYQPRDSYVMQNHDVVLHAQWKKTSFKVKYNNNEEYSRISGISGKIADTDYIYQKDSFASSELYHSEEAEMIFWNTKPDGSGISILPGTNMKGLFDSENELTLYAVWKRNDSDEYVSFHLKLWKEEEGKKEVVDTLKLYGKPGERISVSLMRLFQKELSGESVIYFYKGYEVVNADALQQIVSLESDTEISLIIKERPCTISFQYGKEGQDNFIPDITGKYHEEFILPEIFSDGTKAERYEDSEGKHYFPGDKILLEKNMQLFLQHEIHLHDEKGGEKDVIVYVNHGSDYALPELTQNGYRLIEWSDSMGEKIGNPKQMIKNVVRRYELYARWSEPLIYQITYDLKDSGVKILENSVSYYQYTKGAVLPDTNQVIVPEGYQFDGWYDSRDAKRTLFAKIVSTEYGDKVLKPQLSKKSDSQDSGDKNQNDSQAGDGSGSGNQSESPSGSGSGNQSEGPSGSGSGNQSGGPSDSGSGNQSEGPSDSGGGDQGGNSSGSGNGTQNSNGNATSNGDNPNGNGGTSGTGHNGTNGENPLTGKKHAGKDIGKTGGTFWKGKLKYRIVSLKQGKEKVQVVAVRKKAKKVSVPAKVTDAKTSFRVVSIAKKAFMKSKAVKVVLPKTVTKVGTKAFANMKFLKRATLGAGLKSIAKQAFWKDKRLSKIVIKGRKISKIGKKAFAWISNKAIFQIPKNKKKTYQRMLKKSAGRQLTIISILR